METYLILVILPILHWYHYTEYNDESATNSWEVTEVWKKGEAKN